MSEGEDRRRATSGLRNELAYLISESDRLIENAVNLKHAAEEMGRQSEPTQTSKRKRAAK
jgi:hypothetical protein